MVIMHIILTSHHSLAVISLIILVMVLLPLVRALVLIVWWKDWCISLKNLRLWRHSLSNLLSLIYLEFVTLLHRVLSHRCSIVDWMISVDKLRSITWILYSTFGFCWFNFIWFIVFNISFFLLKIPLWVVLRCLAILFFLLILLWTSVWILTITLTLWTILIQV